MRRYNNSLPYRLIQGNHDNFFNLPTTIRHPFEPEPLNSFESIGDQLSQVEKPLEQYFLGRTTTSISVEQLLDRSRKIRRGPSINDPVFATHSTRYHGLHIDCHNQDTCLCENNHISLPTTVGRAMVTPTIVLTPPSQEPLSVRAR